MNRPHTNTTAAGRICLVLSLLCVALMSFHTITEPDMGYHLHAGRWIIANGTWPDTDTFTYTVTDHDYIDLHWLYQVTVYGIHALGGEFLMVLFHTIFVFAAFALAARQSLHRKAPAGLIAALIVIGAMASDHRFSVRPEVISWVLLAVTIGVLESDRKWWILPVITMLWANIQGIFILGPAVIGCFLLDDLIRQHRFRRERWLPGLAAMFTPLINPYGIRGVLFPLTLSTRLSGENRFAASIGEFLSPISLDFASSGSTFFMVGGFYIFAGITLVAVVFTLRQRTPADILRVVLFGTLAAQAVRNIPLFFLAVLPVTAEAATRAWTGLMGTSPRKYAPKRSGAVSGILLLTLLAGMIITGSWHHVSGKVSRFGFRTCRDFLPVDATAFLNRNAIHGRIFNELRYGGYLGWKWGDPVFIDGRLEVMRHAFFKDYELARQLQIPWRPVHRWHPDIAVFGYTSVPGWFDQFLNHSEWRLVYIDGESAIFLRNGFMDHIQALNCAAITASVISLQDTHRIEQENTGRSIESLIPSGAWYRRMTRILFPTELPRHYFNRGRALQQMDCSREAEQMFVSALQVSRGRRKEIWLALGNLYLAAGREEAARQCYRAVLSLDPWNDPALLQLERLRLF